MTPPPPPGPHTPGKHERVVQAELEKLGWEDTIEGIGALGLAFALDDQWLPGAQRTSMLKQLREVINEIRQEAPRKKDQVDYYQEAARKLRESAQ
jgi:hypothetical protein